MQTLRKLPTIQPNKKNTTDQKWNGTAAQYWGSKMALNMIRCLTHRRFVRVRGALYPRARAGRSRFRALWRPGTATCRGHWRYDSRQLWRFSKSESVPGDRSYRKRHAPVKLRIASYQTANHQQDSGR